MFNWNSPLKNRIEKTNLMSGHSIGFREKIRNYFQNVRMLLAGDQSAAAKFARAIRSFSLEN